MSVVVNSEKLRDYCQSLYVALGMPQEEAFTAADSLVEADMCGMASHGVSRMKIYTKRLETGVVQNKLNLTILDEGPSTLCLDAGNSVGSVVGKRATELTIAKAKKNGCCFTTVRSSNHLGTMAYYLNMMAKAGMIGFAATNAPPNIAPTGSYSPYLGTNPFAVIAPTTGEPVVLDIATCVVAKGKVILAAKEGRSIPEGWALTADGKPTTDPNEGMKGTMVPIGAHKGYGLAFFVDVLCGVLAGAKFGPHLGNLFEDFVNPQDVGHTFMAIDIARFCPVDDFKERLTQMVSEIKALPRIEGVSEIFVPGEIEQRRRAAALENGVTMSDVVYEELRELSERYNVAFTI